MARHEIDFRIIARHLIESSETIEASEIEELGEHLKSIVDEIVKEEIKFCECGKSKAILHHDNKGKLVIRGEDYDKS